MRVSPPTDVHGEALRIANLRDSSQDEQGAVKVYDAEITNNVSERRSADQQAREARA
jgi:hypothetical protein